MGIKLEISPKYKNQKCIYFGQNIKKIKNKKINKNTKEKIDGLFKGTCSEYLLLTHGKEMDMYK